MILIFMAQFVELKAGTTSVKINHRYKTISNN